jgi:hypothetical protein
MRLFEVVIIHNINLGCSFDEIVCVKDRTDCSYFKERLKLKINKYISQKYIIVGQKSLPGFVFSEYVKVSINMNGKILTNHNIVIFPFYAS